MTAINCDVEQDGPFAVSHSDAAPSDAAPSDAAPLGLAPAPLHALRDRLAREAHKLGLIDVSYRTIETRLGVLLLAATARGLVSVTFDGAAPASSLERLAHEIGPRILYDRAALDAPALAIEALIEGRATTFSGPLDFSLARGFGRTVVQRLRSIPYGETRTYGDVAVMAGAPRAARAVGTACRKNPLPIVIPCHRVVRGDGSVGQYAGGQKAKVLLLETEAATSVVE